MPLASCAARVALDAAIRLRFCWRAESSALSRGSERLPEGHSGRREDREDRSGSPKGHSGRSLDAGWAGWPSGGRDETYHWLRVPHEWLWTLRSGCASVGGPRVQRSPEAQSGSPKGHSGRREDREDRSGSPKGHSGRSLDAGWAGWPSAGFRWAKGRGRAWGLGT